MDHKPFAVVVAGSDTWTDAARVEATLARLIQLVPSLADENTTLAAKKALNALRFDKDRRVREAVEAALSNLK